MGSREWGMGDEGAGEAGGERITNAQFPMPYAPCPIPNIQYRKIACQ